MSSESQLVLPGFEYLVPEGPKQEVGEPKPKGVKVSSKVIMQIHNLKDIHQQSCMPTLYNLGLHNGMELITALLEEREPKFIEMKDFNQSRSQ